MNNKELKLKCTYNNYLKISNLNLSDKYTNFEQSKLDESKSLLYEIIEKPKIFKRYSRGQIVRVKFGVNVGSEFSGDHFAIVISKQDTMMNPILHVIPITSKRHKKSLKIGTILYDNNEINKLNDKLKDEIDNKKRKKINRVLKYYLTRKNKVSYACIDHIKSVSKLSISNILLNEFDYLNRIKCNEDILKKIDKAILNEYIVDH